MCVLNQRPRRVKIRKNSLHENVYLDRQAQWVPWKQAAWFSSEQAAERFAKANGVEVFGLFPCESSFGRPCQTPTADMGGNVSCPSSFLRNHA